MSQQYDDHLEQLDNLRRRLADAEQQLQTADRKLEELEARHETVIKDIETLAKFALNNSLQRYRTLLSSEALAAHGDDYPRPYAVSMTLDSIATLTRRSRSFTGRRSVVEFARIAEAAITDLKGLWPWPRQWDFLPFEIDRRELYKGSELSPFEVTVGSTTSVLVDPEWMLIAVRFLIVYALCRTKRTPRVLRMGRCEQSSETVLYITDGDQDVVPDSARRMGPRRHTYSPEFAMFRHIVQAHGGLVWKQRVGADHGTILFSLPDE